MLLLQKNKITKTLKILNFYRKLLYFRYYKFHQRTGSLAAINHDDVSNWLSLDWVAASLIQRVLYMA